MTKYQPTLSYALACDEQDALRNHRGQFHFPVHQGREVRYFCGNSLGLQPRGVDQALQRELQHWRDHAVEGHFRGEMPWMHYHKFLQPQSARLVGAREEEVVVMNTLTVNLHLLMMSFYRPDHRRFRIVMEANAFPSDQYAVESQVRLHGFSPEEAIVEVAPREGEETLRMEDICEVIGRHGHQTALVLFGGVNYYTGQYFDLEGLARAAHRVGAYCGLDLAHTAGNLPLRLHDWGVDFACWCSYKYLNSGPGGPAGIFVHERHGGNPALPRLAGWWGHDEGSRFRMEKGFVPMRGAAGWQLSNAQIFGFAAHKVSLDLFDGVGMEALREKSLRLTGFLHYLLGELQRRRPCFRVITPAEPEARGCQLSLLMLERGRELFDHLSANGVVADWREPDVIRLAPVPLYNSFEDCWQVYDLMERFFESSIQPT